MAMPTCFVVMGFNKKADPNTGKVFDLDKSYRYIIKPAVESAGFECVRADEIQHSGVIDVPMYDRLLNADLVIADLSTSNVNAFFELGVRYALKPRATICIAESGFRNPFDTNHIVCKPYEHAGEAIDYGEVERMRGVLKAACEAARTGDATDSPVFTFLPQLRRPAPGAGPMVPTPGQQTPEELVDRERAKHDAAEGDARRALEEPMAALMQQALAARNREDFAVAASILDGIRAVQGQDVKPFVRQQLAHAIYKSKQPDPVSALLRAREVLRPLDPDRSLDPETTGIWGAIHKRLAERTERTETERATDLDTAIEAYDRGFKLRGDHYNGINLAYMFSVRAAQSTGEDAVADRVNARRVRQRVVGIAREALRIKLQPMPDEENAVREEHFWVKASLVEALFGLGEIDESRRVQSDAEADAPADYMKSTLRDQLAKLEMLLVPREA